MEIEWTANQVAEYWKDQIEETCCSNQEHTQGTNIIFSHKND